MNKLVVASTRKSAGKTSLIVGLAQTMGKTYGYLKPFGDRLLYRKKRLWDYDAALLTSILGMDEKAEEITIGFEHAKLRFMYGEEGTKEKLLSVTETVGEGKEVVFIEAGQDLFYGASIHLDAFSQAKATGAKLLLVVGGNDDTIIDDISFVKKYVDFEGIDFAGVIVNKVADVEDFEATYEPMIAELGVKVLGMIPYNEELTQLSVGYVADFLLAKVIAGENGLSSKVKNILVGAMSTNEMMRDFNYEKENKLLITSGDRSDMVLAALNEKTAAIVLTNNILPPANIVQRANDNDIPLLLVNNDTYQTAKQMDDLEPLLTRDDLGRKELLAELVKKHVKLDEL